MPFREELCSFHREIEVLSEQYSQKCLENAHLAQALEAERQALRQCQRENQELNSHNQVHTHTCSALRHCAHDKPFVSFFCLTLQELNNRLAAEITKMRSMTSEDGTGDPGATIQGKELYELEVVQLLNAASSPFFISMTTVSVELRCWFDVRLHHSCPGDAEGKGV